MREHFYCRVSTDSQHLDRQLALAKQRNISSSQIYVEKLSGKDAKRPELQRMMKAARCGDIVVVESISRFARNAKDLLNLVEKLSSKGADFISIKEAIDTSTFTGKFMLTIFGAVAELERAYLLDRQATGIASAKARGVKFGRPTKKPPENFAEIVTDWEQKKITYEEALARTGLKHTTFYARLREKRATGGK